MGLLYLPFLNHGRIPDRLLRRLRAELALQRTHLRSSREGCAPKAARRAGNAGRTRNRRLAEKDRTPMVAGIICLAHGGNSSVRARHISVVPRLAPALSDLALDAADCSLDREHYPHLCHAASSAPGSAWGSLPGATMLVDMDVWESLLQRSASTVSEDPGRLVLHRTESGSRSHSKVPFLQISVSKTVPRIYTDVRIGLREGICMNPAIV